MSTIQDVATLACVSVATVSRVLNHSPHVSPEASLKVEDAIRQLDYQPNLLGRNLRRTRTHMVLVILPTIANPFYARIVHGIEDAAHREGFNILLCNTGSDPERERLYLGMLSQRLADGAILMSPGLEVEEMERLCRSHPLVQCSEYLEGAAVSHVTIDNRSAARDAVRHLVALGHRRIGLITCRNHFVSTDARLEGYKDALAEAGIEFSPERITYGDYGFASGRRAASRLLCLPEGTRPTAIFAISDLMAIGTVRAAQEAGLSVPTDVAVVGFDDINITSMLEPQITTIAQPKYELGRTAMEILIRQIRGESTTPENITMDHSLIIRSSTLATKIPSER